MAATAQWSEGELVRQISAGDPQALTHLLQTYQERVTRVLCPILRNPMDAEEVAQDVFLTVIAKIDQFRQVSSLATWIHRIAVNAALMRKRRHKNADLSLDDLALPTLPLERPAGDWPAALDDPALRSEAQALIAAAIDRLDGKYRTVFILREVEEFSTATTAEILDLSPAAVKTRLHRARLFLRAELAAYFGAEARSTGYARAS